MRKLIVAIMILSMFSFSNIAEAKTSESNIRRVVKILTIFNVEKEKINRIIGILREEEPQKEVKKVKKEEITRPTGTDSRIFYVKPEA